MAQPTHNGVFRPTPFPSPFQRLSVCGPFSRELEGTHQNSGSCRASNLL